MRAIVTGSAGFIGSHLVRRLSQDGWEVDGIDAKTGPSIQHTAWVAPAEVIFHLASPVGPVGVLGWAGRLVPEVIETASIVSGWARDMGARLVNVSTSEVYGSGGSDAEDDPCSFRAAPSARKEYAVAKLAAETMLHNTDELDVVTIRPFNVAGPGQSAEGGFVLPRFIDQARRGEPLTVYLPGTQRRAFTHVEDVVDGLILAAGTGSGVYNLGNPANVTTIRDLAETVRYVTALDVPIRLVDPVALHGPAFREAPDKLPNAAKAMRELGWHPTRGLHQIIADANLAEYRAAA